MRIKDQRGGALIEFAIVFPLLGLLVGGLVDFGILYYDKQVLTNASREGARAGIVYEVDDDGNKIIITDTKIQNIVDAYCYNPTHPWKRLWTFGGSFLPTTTVTSIQLGTPPIDYLRVQVDFTYTFVMSSLLNILGGDFGPTLPISAVTVMRME